MKNIEAILTERTLFAPIKFTSFAKNSSIFKAFLSNKPLVFDLCKV